MVRAREQRLTVVNTVALERLRQALHWLQALLYWVWIDGWALEEPNPLDPAPAARAAC